MLRQGHVYHFPFLQTTPSVQELAVIFKWGVFSLLLNARYQLFDSFGLSTVASTHHNPPNMLNGGRVGTAARPVEALRLSCCGEKLLWCLQNVVWAFCCWNAQEPSLKRILSSRQHMLLHNLCKLSLLLLHYLCEHGKSPLHERDTNVHKWTLGCSKERFLVALVNFYSLLSLMLV